ncbi:MAG TPA: C25 family peptidase propeptide domain-containing protein, partial [Candidatus Kapabacteria bacterium]|nr:C25 family peptidase propeptide domain-containing protein [Candidatus Kapabacteria bacterium]
MNTARNIFALWMLMLLCAANATAGNNYKVLSSTSSEMIIEVKPQYRFDTIRTSNGEFIKVHFPDARFDEAIGAPMIPRLQLGFLLPARTPLNVEIIEQVLSGNKQMTLAPYPVITQTADGPQARYEYSDFNAADFAQLELITKDPVTTARTAYAQHVQIAPVRYDAEARSVKLVESIKLRIRFYGKPLQVNASPLSLAEIDMFHAGYVNGTNASLYRSAQAQAMQIALKESGAKAMKASPQTTGEWLTIETDREGVYKITADDLRGAGITSLDPNSLELFGYGARMMPETITDSSGEWRPVAIDVRTDGSGQLSEFLFYSPGTQIWKYQRRADRLFGLYHINNPYMSVG